MTWQGYDGFMVKLLPFSFLIATFSIFGLVWIILDVDPDSAPWYIFAVFDLLLFVSVWGLLGLALYFIRTRFYKRYSANWYFKTSFKMAFFVALFASVVAILAILRLITVFNLILAIVAISLFAVWSYLGKKN